MLQIVLPLSFISSSVDVYVDTVAIGLIIDPIALVDVSVDVNELAVPVCPVVAPLTFVSGTIRPNLNSVAIAETPNPLTLICRTSFECVYRPFLTLSLWVVLLLRHSLLGFLHCEVFAVSLIII